MSGVTVRRKVSFRKALAKPIDVNPTGSPAQVSRVARMLALAHYIDRLVESGAIKDYAEAARRLGLTRARVTQVMNLLNLSVPVQEGLLTGQFNISERRLRELQSRPEWRLHQV